MPNLTPHFYIRHSVIELPRYVLDDGYRNVLAELPELGTVDHTVIDHFLRNALELLHVPVEHLHDGSSVQAHQSSGALPCNK